MSANDTKVHRLFSNGERGVWYDPKDISTMYQDSSGTTPVTGDAQPVGLIFDKSKEVRIDDRSVNDRSLKVVGTLQRNPVATGADLVAYSGFSASNYLEQPYNPDLDFGTGDFCVMGWVNNASVFDTYLSRSDGNGNGWYLQRGDTYIWFSLSSGGSIITGNIPEGSWCLVTLLRKSNTLYAYVNRELQGSVFSNGTMTFPESTLILGRKQDGLPGSSDPMTGSLALFRISATAPTAEQIAKIYRDEKVLFQENAKATLYGTSDAVTALAYDDVTDLLHVGTSSGRSDFKGLRRINNTTDAVSTTISASNGLIVEE